MTTGPGDGQAVPQRVAALLAAALGGWDALWYAGIHPTSALPPPVGALLLAVPILLCVRHAWRGIPLALGGAGFLAIGYLAHGLMELVANPPERIAAGISSLLALAVLIAASHALRSISARSRAAGPAG